jgi:hypothetical protein
MMTCRLSVVDFHVLFDHQCMCSVVVARFTRMFGRCTKSVRAVEVSAAKCGEGGDKHESGEGSGGLPL